MPRRAVTIIGTHVTDSLQAAMLAGCLVASATPVPEPRARSDQPTLHRNTICILAAHRIRNQARSARPLRLVLAITVRTVTVITAEGTVGLLCPAMTLSVS